MAKKAAAAEPKLFEASLATDGAVHKGSEITRQQAEERRRNGDDVVVCGPDLSANRRLAGEIETSANEKAKRCPPHASAGPRALPHYQPETRPPAGHTFYETPNRKAV